MKTADLIPFILLELNECDKYGFELTKNIEAKSGGKIIIKQPTLYTLLKKLEKSKFIASYWQDSEIGGKRHYYKLTENGKLQVSTLPSYDALMKNALNEDVEIDMSSFSESISSTATPIEDSKLSIMDELLSKNTESFESVLPSDEVFDNNNIDFTTELEQNIENTEILKDKTESFDEKFASNAEITKFTEKIPKETRSNMVFSSKNTTDILNYDFIPPQNNLDVKYVDYIDFKNRKENIYARKVAAKRLLQILATSISIIVILSLCHLITHFTGRSAIYYTCLITGILISIFYPVIYSVNIEKSRLKYQTNPYQIKLKQRVYFGLALLSTIAVASIVISVCIGKSTFALLFGYTNFANLYMPILLCSSYFLDMLYAHLLMSKIKL